MTPLQVHLLNATPSPRRVARRTPFLMLILLGLIAGYALAQLT